ncbi:MAG: amidophosphoribosyltransferase [Proteobacteria bacterium]|nr:amidophosphoribosyltransferase [Pseudomonadota bacterium]
MPDLSLNHNLESDRLREECGVVGVYGDPNASQMLYLALFALQHRGQEACGLVTFEEVSSPNKEESVEPNKVNLHVHKAFGLVGDSVTDKVIQSLKGHFGVGHVRYSTQGGDLLENIQPFQFKTALGPVAIAHNGNLTNAREIRKGLEASGSVFHSTSDSEVFVHLIARSDADSMGDRIGDAVRQVKGAYSLAIMTKSSLYAVRDPLGFRPLALGKKDSGWVVASESCAFDLIGAKFERDILPGEVVEISSSGVNSWFPQPKRDQSFCSFEPIYFARPDSLLYGENIYLRRGLIGEVLAEECPAEGDFVMAIPDSGLAMAEGFARKSGLPLKTGLVRNHYIGRTFIAPTQAVRDFGVKIKLNPLKSVLAGKRVIVVDDSLVRGTTSARIFKMLREAGAKEIHFRVGAPPITHSCFYGVDTPKRKDLMAAQLTVPQIGARLGADSIGFISVAGLEKALGSASDRGYCMACFTGKYPEDICQPIEREPTDGVVGNS